MEDVDGMTYNDMKAWVHFYTPEGSPIRICLPEALDKAKAYDDIMEIARENSLASDGLEMIHSAMRDASD